LAKASLLMDSEAAVIAKAATVAVRMDFMVGLRSVLGERSSPPMTANLETPWLTRSDGRHKKAASAGVRS
jgi:hypothetical protein